MAGYAQHVVVFSGKKDWVSRIEEDDFGGDPERGKRREGMRVGDEVGEGNGHAEGPMRAETGWGGLVRGLKGMMSARAGGEFVDVSTVPEHCCFL